MNEWRDASDAEPAPISEAVTVPPAAPPSEAATIAPLAAAASPYPSETATLPPVSPAADPDATRYSDASPASPTMAGGGLTIPGYDLLGELGRGGMGVVYKARQTKLNRVVALKMILAGGHAGEADLARFRTEAEAVARLQHPNIVQIFEVGEHGGLPFFSLEFCGGGSLDRKLNGTPLPPQEAAALVETLARAMQAAHDKGVIHRDLKPANVLLSEDGTAKITDFGLAKRLDADLGQTRTGSVMGTPSYMAPEQAGGKSKEMGPLCDVYSLGAILYECLTGRPPFRAATPLDTMMQVVSDDPVPPRQLQSKTPRDLETICLKCLEKQPARRYGTALELAEDLRRFQADEPIRARPVGTLERGWKWARRRPALAALAATLLLAIGGAGAGALWLQHDQSVRAAEHARRAADTERDVTAALDEAAALGRTAAALREDPRRWEATLAEALSAVKRADGVQSGGVDDTGELGRRVAAMRADVEAAEKDRDMVAHLEDARLRAAAAGAGGFDFEGSAALYTAAFEGDMNLSALDTKQAAERINQRAIRDEMLTGLEDWARVSSNHDQAERLLRIVQAADPDPGSFRNRCQALLARKDWEGVRLLALGSEAEQLPTGDLGRLGQELEAAAGPAEAAKFLKAIDQRRSGDFWINLDLALACWRMQPEAVDDAIRYNTAAVALRPQSAVAHSNLGAVLHDKGLLDEAIAECRKAIALSSDGPEAHNNLGGILGKKGQVDEAIAELRKALQLKPDFAKAHDNLGAMLTLKRNFDEAIVEGREAVRLAPRDADAHYNLGNVLSDLRRWDEAITEYRQALDLAPDLPDARCSLAVALLEKGLPDQAMPEFRKALQQAPRDARCRFGLGTAHLDKGELEPALTEFQAAIDLKPDYAEAHGNLAAVLRAKGRLDEAIAEYRKTIDLQPDFAESHYDLAIVLREAGRLDEAVAEYRKTLDLKPDLAQAWCNLGGVLRAQGRFTEALVAVRRGHELGAKIPGWPYPSAQWVHEAVELVRLDAMLSPVLRGEAEPASRAAALRFADLCTQKHRYGNAARLYADALGPGPALPNDLPSVARYNAACVAALAGCGKGEDAATADEPGRARWRKQALEWLRADLALWIKQIDSAKLQDRTAAVQALQHWKGDADLSGVRGAALARLPAEEQDAWRTLWADVDALLKKAQEK